MWKIINLIRKTCFVDAKEVDRIPEQAPSLAGWRVWTDELRSNLERLTHAKGIKLAVCASEYGEVTENGFGTFYEVFKNNKDVLPLKAQDDWKPNLFPGEGHLDRDSPALGLLTLFFQA